MAVLDRRPTPPSTPATTPAPAGTWDDRTLELVRRLPGRFLVVLDEGYVIRWASHHVGRILATSTADLIGRPAPELIHPDDLALGASELGRLSAEAATDLEAMEADLDHTATLRLLAGDGSPVSVEFKAFNLFADPEVRALGLLGRVVSTQVRLDAVIDRLGTDASLGDVLALLADYLSTAASRLEHRIVRFVDGRALGPDDRSITPDDRSITDDPLLPAAVLEAALATTEHRSTFRDLDALPPSTRAVLAERHLTTCFAYPIVVNGRSEPLGAVVTWVEGDTLALGAHDVVATTARLAGLAMAVHGNADGLRVAAMTDALTGLANRRQLDEWSAAVHGPVAVLAIDLDAFKPINDRFGHAAGDLVLVEVAARLRASCRAGALVARPGGDEFVVLVPGIDRLAHAEGVAGRFLAAMSAPIALAGTTVAVGASMGSAVRAPGEAMADVLARADAALYATKRASR